MRLTCQRLVYLNRDRSREGTKKTWLSKSWEHLLMMCRPSNSIRICFLQLKWKSHLYHSISRLWICCGD
jgi:hypothetical protein